MTRTASRQPLRVAPVVLCRATYLLQYDRPGLGDNPHGGSTRTVELSMTGSRSDGVNGPKGHLLRVECSAASVFSEIGMLVSSPGASAMFPTGSFCGELYSQGGGAALEGPSPCEGVQMMIAFFALVWASLLFRCESRGQGLRSAAEVSLN